MIIATTIMIMLLLILVTAITITMVSIAIGVTTMHNFTAIALIVAVCVYYCDP